jgi:hypothetical protein
LIGEHQYALLLAYGNPWLSAVLLPVAVDGLIVLASVCLAVIAERRRALTEAKITELETGPVRAGAQIANAGAESAAPVAEIGQTAWVGPGVRQVEQPSTQDDLTAAARAVAQELTAAGRKVSRDALATALRARGHRLGTDRAAALVRAVAPG